MVVALNEDNAATTAASLKEDCNTKALEMEIATLEESNAAKEVEINRLCQLVDGYREEQQTSLLLLTQYKELYYSTVKVSKLRKTKFITGERKLVSKCNQVAIDEIVA